MCAHICPAERVEQEGRHIDLKDTFGATCAQLQLGEELAVVGERQHGKVALLIKNGDDFYAAKTSTIDLCGLYAISVELASTAS
jgi:hypothetical protein